MPRSGKPVVNGTADVPYIQQISRLLASGVPGARTADLVDTAHLPPVERPDETNAVILDFLAR
jgi:pimeloyl-ACP methyl ester carboxylesterase